MFHVIIMIMNKDKIRKMVGLILWWAEGTKSRRDKRGKNTWSYNVEVTNTNPRIIKHFLNFLRKDIGIDENRLKLQLQIHEGDDKSSVENFWSKFTEIPLHRFNNTFIRPKGNKVGKTQGTCKIRYSSKTTYKVIEEQLENLLNSLE